MPLKTYLPDGDIDLTVLSTPNVDELLPREVLRVLKEEEQNKTSEFEVKDTQFIDAEVILVILPFYYLKGSLKPHFRIIFV